MNTSPQVFQESAAVYDLLYGEKDTLAEAEWLPPPWRAMGALPVAVFSSLVQALGDMLGYWRIGATKSPVWNRAPTCSSVLNRMLE